MANYDIFAEFYDQIMGERTESLEKVKSLISQYNPKARSVLELAVGTGSVIKGLSKEYEVAGLDLSSEMLSIAKKKVPQANIYKEDMSNFNIGRFFDVIICVFDSINHLTEFEQWDSMLSSVSKHLNVGGIFIFDMNTLGRLKTIFRECRSTGV